MNEKTRLKKEENFIKHANEIHKGFYNYGKVYFKFQKEKVEIICPIHGSFYLSPQVHLKGHGCPHCNGGISYTKNTFIEKANVVHNNFYTYDSVDYKNSTSKVKITCPKHGNFYLRPDVHLRGLGCPICNTTAKMTTEKYVLKLKDIFGNRYDFSKTVYTGPHKNVIATCPIHGDFEKRACFFLRGSGCQKCSNHGTSNTELEVYEYVKSILNKNIKIIRNTKKHLYLNGKLTNYEIDIFIPLLKVGIEVNGEYWHNMAERQFPGYHKLKRDLFRLNNIKLINVSYKNWLKKKQELKNYIRKKIAELNNNA